MATIAQMRQTATQIQTETQVGGNTADRVGGLFNDVVNKLEEDETAVANGLATKQDTLTFDHIPTNGSQNPVTSDGIYQNTPSIQGNPNSDLDFADPNGNVILRLKNGHIQTKYFDSENPFTISGNTIIIQ